MIMIFGFSFLPLHLLLPLPKALENLSRTVSVRKACKKSQRCCSHGGGRQQEWVARKDALARRAVSLFHFLFLHSILMALCLLALFFVA